MAQLGKCVWCGIVGRPFSTIIRTRCDECADWKVFEAMVDAWWYVNERHSTITYHMHLHHWYEALAADGVPRGYPKAHNRWYAPYSGIFKKPHIVGRGNCMLHDTLQDLTASPETAIMEQPVTKPSSEVNAPTWGCEDIT